MSPSLHSDDSRNNGKSPNDYETQQGETHGNVQSDRPGNLLVQASIVSRLFFNWAWPLLSLGLKRPLQESDLPEISPLDSSLINRASLERIWNEEKQLHSDHPSLHRAILKRFLLNIWFIQPILMAGATAKVVQAYGLGRLVESFGQGDNRGSYAWACVMVFCGSIVLFHHHHAFFFTWREGMRLRIACVASIYEKSLRLSSTHQETSASYGRIMNLASNDVERFIQASLFFNHLLWAPLQALAILAVGLSTIGPSFAAGFGLLVIVFVPLQFHLSKKFAHYRSKIAAITDKRVTLVSQAVYGVRVMKMSGFEWRFLERIQKIRRQEIAQIKKADNLKAWNEALFFCTNIVVSLVIFLVHVLIGDQLTPRDVFTAFTLINIMQLELTKHASMGVMGTSECMVSISRIQKFLEFPELPSVTSEQEPITSLYAQQRPEEASLEEIALSFSNVTCYWNYVTETRQKGISAGNKPPDLVALSQVSLDCRRGELTCIIGTVGSGKSALLQAMVGELRPSSGTLTRHYSTLAYAAQDPWIMDGTVRENIVMGLEFNQHWYDDVVNACGLALDFTQFHNGDATVVGDRGVQCSGGQRARIGLARALYRDADVLVCDDPLSAVDAKVGRLLFYEAIQQLAVNRGKCVVLATHQHQFVLESRCVLMVGGRIEHVGTYDECVAASNGQLKAHEGDDTVDNLTEDVVDEQAEPDKAGIPHILKNPFSKANEDTKEVKVTGLVRFSTYIQYAKAMGGVWVGIFLILLFCVTQVAAFLSIFYVGKWARRPAGEQSEWDILGLIIGLGASVVVFAILRAMICLHLTVTASQRLHDRMTEAVLRAKIQFFDTNPMGRILNRFSADIGSNDDQLPPTLFDFLMISFMVVGAMLTTIVVLPFILVIFPFLLWYFISVRRTFITSTRELKRLEGAARSPIFAMLSESLNGIATLRANDTVRYFQKKFQDAHDAHTRAFFAFIACSRWVGFRMDGLVFIFFSVACFLAVVCHQQGWLKINPSVLGLALSYLLQLAGLFQWAVRQSAEVVNQMVSVERVLEYGDLPSEGALRMDSDDELNKKGWPTAGAIQVEDFSVRYRPNLPLSLEKVSFSIPSGARVGVVGRTGSGKSTLVQSLFRLLDAESGSIRIDNVDIASLGLHTLRTNIAVMTQLPTLFSGCSVRDNLDLFGIHSDDSLRKALDDVKMLKVIEELPGGWDSIVAEGGSNFSVGQRQLLCLARAILTKSKILILDEATSAIDRLTDQRLQEALQESFHDATILAVAHRLDTVIDCDYILVLGLGRVLEFGSPAELIQSGGQFASMIQDTGDAMSRELIQRAMARQRLKASK